MLKNYVLNIVEEAIKKLNSEIDLSQFKLVAEKPKNAEFGDFSVNVSSLAKIFIKSDSRNFRQKRRLCTQQFRARFKS